MEITGYSSYLIYPDGRVFSKKSNRFLKQTLQTQGYLAVEMRAFGKRYCKRIHRLIGEHYIPNPDNKPTIDHMNRDRSDNRIENLRWATMEEQRHNQRKYSTNTSGHRHIQYCKTHKKWKFNHTRPYKNRYFKSKIDAICYKFIFLLKYV
jgi:hypothetical protein